MLAPHLRKFGGYSVSDFLGERFGGTGVRPLAIVGVILCAFPALAVALLALGVLAERLFAVDSGTGVALGMGADRAVHVKDPAAEGSDALGVAKILAAVAKQENPDLIFMGLMSDDANFAAVPPISGYGLISWISRLR